jgi:copper chaperone CopZ
VIQEEIVQVSGIRCENCVGRLGQALEGHPGLAAAQANLVGQVFLSWDDDETTREALLDRLGQAGFHPA